MKSISQRGREGCVKKRWLMVVLDASKINERISALEEERLSLQNAAKGKVTVPDAKVDGLASLLEVAVRNNDIDTIDALVLDYGALPSLLKAKLLIQESLKAKKKAQLQKLQNDLEEKLYSLKEFNYDHLKVIKDQIEAIGELEIKTSLQKDLLEIIRTQKPILSTAFKDSLSETNWLKSPISEQTASAFTDLINLQALLPFSTEPLWAFEIIAKQFEISFNYHFNSSQETNRIDKPELFYNFYLGYLDKTLDNTSKIWSLCQTALHERFAYSEFITASIVPVQSKLKQYLTVLRSNAEDKESVELLIHLILETIQFDTKLATDHQYDPLNNSLWPGLFSIFKYEDLEKWLGREIHLNLSQFDKIVNSSNVFEIDYTSVDSTELKPTISSLKIKYLLENITKWFQLVFFPNYDQNQSLIKFKLKFFSKVYLGLLTAYLHRLSDGYDALRDLFKSKGSAEIDITGTKGIERIFRLYCSIKYVSNSLRYWNQEFIFIELNNLFIQLSQSSSLSLFDSIISDYSKLESKAWELLEKFIDRNLNSIVKPYEAVNTWRYLTSEPQHISIELSGLIETVTEYTQFISRIIPSTDLIILKNHTSATITGFVMTNVIKSNHFNYYGVKQLQFDVEKTWSLLHLSRHFPAFYKLEEALKLLSLTREDVAEFTNVTVSQYAKTGDYSALRSRGVKWLRDSDILDILLRLHQE